MVLFINTIRVPYYEKLVGSAIKSFFDMVIFDEMIENAVKNGKLDVGEKREALQEKKERETQKVFLGGHSNKGNTLYPTYSNYPPYYPTINNITQTPYFYQSSRLENPPT